MDLTLSPVTDECERWWNEKAPVFKNFAEKCLFDGGGSGKNNNQITPVLLMFHKSGKTAIAEHDPFDETGLNQEIAAHIQSIVMQHEQTRATLFISETWSLLMDVNPDGTIPESPKGSWEHVPGRTESVMFSLIYRADDGTIQQLITIYPVDRENRKLSEAKQMRSGSDLISGLFVGQEPKQ